MSSPVERRLRDLNLDPEMAASTGRKGKGRQAAQGQASQQAAQAGPSNPNHLTSDKSGTTYDIQGFSDEARKRADAGFNRTSGGPLELARDMEGYFAFQLGAPSRTTVRVGPPGYEQSDSRPCTCGKADKNIACEHVFWLVDQVVPAASPQLHKLAPNGLLVRDVPLFELIRDIGIEELTERIRLRAQRPPKAITEEDREAVKERMLNQLHEILSTFEPGSALPDELRSEAGRVYKEFSDFIVEIAYRRPGAIDRLERIVPSQLRAAIHFERTRDQVNQAFYKFDHDDDFDIPDCIASLRELADQVVENYAERSADEAPDVAKYAVGVLVTILEGIISRKEELYGPALGERDASLSFDVLEALSTKPAEALSLYRDRIAHVAHEVETNGAPPPILSLMSKVAGVVGVAGVTAASESQKRKGPGDNGDNGGSKKKGKSKK